jgi:hypothetical protein
MTVPKKDLQADVPVDELLQARRGPIDVVLLDAALRAEPDPAGNVRRLIDAGHRVLVIDGSAAPISAARVLAVDADRYLTREHGLAILADTLRVIAAGGRVQFPRASVAAEPDGHPILPPLSEREHAVLMAYVPEGVKAKYPAGGATRLYQCGPRRTSASGLAGGAGPRQVLNITLGHHDHLCTLTGPPAALADAGVIA